MAVTPHVVTYEAENICLPMLQINIRIQKMCYCVGFIHLHIVSELHGCQLHCIVNLVDLYKFLKQ